MYICNVLRVKRVINISISTITNNNIVFRTAQTPSTDEDQGLWEEMPQIEVPTIRFVFIVYDMRVTMHREKLLQGKPFEGFGCLDLRHWRPASYSLGKISIRRLKSLQRTLILISH